MKVAFAVAIFGLFLVLNSLTSRAAQRLRGRESTMGLYRNQERLARLSVQVGTVLFALGLAGVMLLFILG